jgi:tetratricopeptide (TPR) repeat protein
VKIRLRVISLSLLALAALLPTAGCERTSTTPFTAEVDEPSYRRAKDLLRQGRNQEALTEFEKVIEIRGLNNAAESHLELGLLYQHHIRDPISAIYHYRRYRELKPNSPQADLVRQRIDAATREFARTLPAQPMDNPDHDMTDIVQRLQRENEQLKTELARIRNMVVPKNRTDPGSAVVEEEPLLDTPGPAHAPVPDRESSPISRASNDVPASSPVAPPATASRSPLPATAVTQPPRVAQSAASAAVRKHVVGKGDTLTSLALRYYGNRSRWRDIAEANKDVLKNKDGLRLGMELKIPF